MTTFQYNPLNPDIIVGGCYNGQVILWDTSGTPAAAAGHGSDGGKGGAAAGGRASGKGAARGSSAGAWEDDREGEATTAVISHK